jgi:hypothetical protein
VRRSTARSRNHSLRLLTLGVLLPALGYWGVVALLATPPKADREVGEIKETLAVLVTASFCIAAQREELTQAWPTILASLAERVERDGARLRTLGVSIDVDPLEGVEALSRYGTFDEIVSGSNWANLGVRTYVWEALPGQAAIPQVIVVSRTLRQGPAGYQVLDEEEVDRMVGIAAIVRGAERGPR